MSTNYEAAYDAFGGKDKTEQLLEQLRSMGISEYIIASSLTPYFKTAPTPPARDLQPPTKDLRPPEGPPPFAPDKVVIPEDVTSLPETKTFSDEITAGTPTTQDEFLSVISKPIVVPDTITPIVAKAGSGTTYTGTDWPSIIYGSTGTDGELLSTTTTSDGTPFYLHDTDEGGYYQNPATVESYAPFTGEDGKTYYAVYAPTFSSGKAWNETPVTSVLTESQYKALKGGDSAIGNLINSPVGSFALNLLGPYGQLITTANAVDKGDYTGALLSGLNAAGGFGYTDIGNIDLKTAKNAASLLNAVDKNNLAGALTAGSNLLGGVPGDFKTASTLAGATLAIKNNDTAGFLNSLGELTGSSDAKVAAAAVKLKEVFESGNTAQLNSAMNNFASAVGGTSTSGTSGSTGSTGSNITTLSAEDLQELNPGELQAYEANGVQGLSNFRKDMKLLNSLTGSGYTGDSTGGDYTPDTTTSGLPTGVQLASLDGGLGTTNLGGVSGTTFPDLTNDATIKSDADLFNSTIGTLDQLDSTRTSDEFADFLESIGITSLDQLTDSGLSNQDILDMINATDDTVTVTGKTDGTKVDGVDTIIGTDDTVTVTGKKDGTDTTGTTITGTDGTGLGVEDKGTVTVTGKKESCPVGTVLNPETGECDVVEDKGTVTVTGKKESCPVGTVLNPETGECDVVEDKALVCDAGYHEENGVCVKDTLTCPEGKVLNADGTACIDEIVITDNKCDPGFVYDEDLKMCVPIVEECLPGFHMENGSCVPDEVKCETGYHLENGVCVKDALVCAEGFQLNEAGTECIPVVKITECKEGFHRDETGACVPDEVKCDTGYHLENGVCVPDEIKCEKGYHLEDGKCVKDKLECPEGYQLNEAGTECIPVVKITECKEGFHRNAEGVCVPDTITCETGYHEENGVCVPDEIKCEKGYHLEDGKCVKDKLECPEGYELNDAGTECIPIVKITECKEGYHRNAEGVCVPDTEECAEGFHLEDGICVADDDEKCKDGYEKVNGVCVPVCKEGYIRNLETGTCEKPEDKACPVGQVKDASGKCVPIAKTTECSPGYEKINGVCVPVCLPGYQRVNGVCTLIPKTATTTGTASSGQEEKIDPIYATGMDDFDLFATLEELLNGNSDKSDKKKDSKKSKEKTKMATGGHLDDLLAEQMTVDDLLKLLR